MQRIQDYGLLGLGSVAEVAVPPPPNAADIVVVERQRPQPTNKRTATTGRKPAPTGTTSGSARDNNGRLWISEERANTSNLPEGNYVYRGADGGVRRLDIGAHACQRALLDLRLRRADRTGGFADREARPGGKVRVR